MVPERIDNILVPLDGSSFAENALPYGGELSAAFGARATLFRATPNADYFRANSDWAHFGCAAGFRYISDMFETLGQALATTSTQSKAVEIFCVKCRASTAFRHIQAATVKGGRPAARFRFTSGRGPPPRSGAVAPRPRLERHPQIVPARFDTGIKDHCAFCSTTTPCWMPSLFLSSEGTYAMTIFSGVVSLLKMPSGSVLSSL